MLRSRAFALALSCIGVLLAAMVSPAQAATTPPWKTVIKDGFDRAEIYDSAHQDWGSSDMNDPTNAAKGWRIDPNNVFTGTGSVTASLSRPYPDKTNSFLVSRDFSLKKATAAQMRFAYRINTEKNYDFLGWEYSCDFGQTWYSRSVSGVAGWIKAVQPLTKCVGKPHVKVQFTFRSDVDNSQVTEPANLGVWIDSVTIEKR